MNTQDNVNDRLDVLQAELAALNAKIRKIDFTPSGRVRLDLTASQAIRRMELLQHAQQVATEINQIAYDHRELGTCA